HLPDIVAALRSAGVDWQATDIDRLRSLAMIEDMLSLTRALDNPGDRLAWLAILRAPWCGLQIADLHAVARSASACSIWHSLQSPQQIEGLSADGQARLSGLANILAQVMALSGVLPLSQRLNTLWRKLGGEALYDHVQARDCSLRYFEILEEFEQKQVNREISLFETMLDKAFVPNPRGSEAENPVQIMTIHKAKGLEFDHVILPGLSRGKPSERHGLLRWFERVNTSGRDRLFLAVRSARGQDSDAMYELLRYEQDQKLALEDTRLMYIAVTRARQSVLLLATITANEGELKAPAGSLLATIWPQLQQWPQLEHRAIDGLDVATDVAGDLNQLRRLAAPLPPAPPVPLETADAELPEEKPSPVISGSELQLRALQGDLVHRGLQSLAEHGEALWQEQRLQGLRRFWKSQLSSLVSGKHLEESRQFIEDSIRQTWDNKQLAWIFDPRQQDSHSELPVQYRSADGIKLMRVDRTLLDEKGQRWIIDYKSAEMGQDEDPEQFKHRQLAAHRKQLLFYREKLATVHGLDREAIRVGLVLTDLAEFVELV
ncbi:MAG: 3'-5' exonuclease, partial [Gammaproteobacteria bacterium]